MDLSFSNVNGSHAHGNKSRVGHEFWFKPPSDWYGYDTNVMNGLVSRVGHEFWFKLPSDRYG